MSTLKTNNIQHVDAASPSISLDTGGNVTVTGIITATSFSGSGANLTGIAATANVVTNSLVVSGVSTFAAGSASAPSISPTGDSNTGIFFPSADTIAFAEGGAEVARFDSSGRFGLGTTSLSGANLVINTNSEGGSGIKLIGKSANGGSEIDFRNNADSTLNGFVEFTDTQGVISTVISGPLTFRTGNTERARVDSSGKLLIGTSTVLRSGDGIGIQIKGATNDCVYMNYGIGKINPASGDAIGIHRFTDSSGNIGCQIITEADANWTSGSEHPSRIKFATCPTGSTTVTERGRITSGGFSKFTNNGSYRSSTGSSHELYSDSNSQILFVTATNGSFGSDGMLINVHRAANSGYNFFVTNSGNGADTEHYLRGDGQAYADGSWNGGGADYAEYFEWSDANPDAEDRRGISVVLDGDKIREAAAGEDPIGVISGNPSVVGDAAATKWIGKYLRDDYGSYILDENGERQLNPAHDPDQEYVSREDRPEWDCVGLMGKLRIRKGQVTGARWIKMRDVSATVEEWLVR